MSKYRIFKCKKDVCYCNQSWIVSAGGQVLMITRDHSAALHWVLEQIELEAAA